MTSHYNPLGFFNKQRVVNVVVTKGNCPPRSTDQQLPMVDVGGMFFRRVFMANNPSLTYGLKGNQWLISPDQKALFLGCFLFLHPEKKKGQTDPKP